MTTLKAYLLHQIRRRQWLQFSLVTASLSFASGYAVLWLLAQAGWITTALSAPSSSRLGLIVGGLILAPVIENLLMVVALALLQTVLPAHPAAMTMGVIAAVIHAAVNSWMGIAALVQFTVMGVSYLAWKQHQGSRTAYWVTVLQHALFNTPSVLWTAFVAAPGVAP